MIASIRTGLDYGMLDLPRRGHPTGSSGVLVGVVDDGIRFDHPTSRPISTRDGYDFVSNDFTACSGAASRAATGRLRPRPDRASVL